MLLSVLWLLPAFCPDGNDREIFRFIGRSIRNGFIPYKDVFDHKPPFIYFIFLVFSPFGEWDVFISGTLFLGLSVYFIKKLTSETNDYWSLLIPVFLTIWLRNPRFYEYGGLTREYSAYLYCIFFYCFHLNKRIEWLALIMGTVFINQQNDILPLLPFFFHALYKNKVYSVINVIRLFFIFSLPFIIVSVWLMINGGFENFINQAFIFNFKYYTKPFYHFHYNNIIQIIRTFGYWINFGIVGLIMICIYLLRIQNWKLSMILITSFLFAIYNISVSGRYYGHYFLPIGPILVYSILLIIKESKKSKALNPLMITVLFTFIVSIIWNNRSFSLPKQIETVHQQSLVKKQILSIINKNLEDLNYIYFVNYTPGLNFNTISNKRPPSNYIYFNIWDEIPAWDKHLVKFKTITNQMNKPKTMVFDFTQGSRPFIRKEMNTELIIQLQTNFKQCGSIDNIDKSPIASIYLSDNVKNP